MKSLILLLCFWNTACRNFEQNPVEVVSKTINREFAKPQLKVVAKPQIGVASYYSTKCNRGSKTASGQKLKDHELTAAHKTLKFGTQVKVTNLKNNKSTIVKITDRGPYIKGRVIDLTLAAAKRIDMIKSGVTKVKIEVVKPNIKKEIES